MKRKNLILSLISSVLVCIAIVAVTIFSVVPMNKKTNGSDNGTTVVTDTEKQEYEEENKNRDGSEDKPYLLYDAESFVNYISEYGDQDKYFELAADIDFAKFDYKPLFNNGKVFNSSINGKGCTLQNISINVTTENLESENYSYASGDYRLAHIGIFGDMNEANINDLKVEGLKVNVADEVYDFIKEAKYETHVAYREIAVGTIAGFAYSSTFDKVVVNAEVNATSYAVSTGYAAVGGFAAVVTNLNLSNSTVNVTINAKAGENFNVGGVAGYAYGATASNIESVVTVNTSCDKQLNIAGVFAYGQKNVVIDSSNVKLTVKEIVSGAVAGDNLTNIAGVVCVLRANESYKSTISNVEVVADIDIDAVYAGVIMDVLSNALTNKTLITISDVIANSNVDVLAVYGYGRQLNSTTINFTEEKLSAENYFNIRITGNAKLDDYKLGGKNITAKAFFSYTNDASSLSVSLSDLHIIVSKSIKNTKNLMDIVRMKESIYGSVKSAD